MAYSILRAKKLKSIGAVLRSGQHTFRERLTPNADPGMSNKNQSRGARCASELISRLKSALPEKRRKDAVLAIEYLVTASPEAFKRHGGWMSDLGSGYFNDAVHWIKKRHGRENILCSAVHLDETTPHMVVYVVPRTADGRLSCRDFLGGPKVLTAMQSDFHDSCGAKHGLERGVVGTRVKHERIKAFYSNLAEQGSVPQLSKADYAAAAFGLKTKSWVDAERIARANALGIARASRARKTAKQRISAVNTQLSSVSEIADELEVQRSLLARRLNELEERSSLLLKREADIEVAEARILSIEAENEALRRVHRPLSFEGSVRDRPVAASACDLHSW